MFHINVILVLYFTLLWKICYLVSAARNELTQLLKDTTLIDDPVLANEVHIVSFRRFAYDTFLYCALKVVGDSAW